MRTKTKRSLTTPYLRSLQVSNPQHDEGDCFGRKGATRNDAVWFNMPCYCYIVECADGTYYTGWTVDPDQRVAIHNRGRGAKYTKMRLPVRLVYVEEQPDRRSAMKREMAIKKLGRKGKEKLVSGSKDGNR